MSAVGTGAIGLTGLTGLLAANTRVRRAVGSVSADYFVAGQAVGVRVRAVVRATGLGQLKLCAGDDTPKITVTEIRITEEGDQVRHTSWVKQVLPGEVIDPTESASATFVVPVDRPVVNTLGWEVVFEFAVRRRWPHHDDLWYWTNTDFGPRSPRPLRPRRRAVSW